MNKKLIAAIVAGVVAVALIVVGIVFVANDISFGGKDKGDNTSTSQKDDKDETSKDNTVGDNKDDKTDKTDNTKEEIETNKGKTVEIPVYVSASKGFVGAQLFFEYDSKALSYVGYDEGNMLDECDVNHTEGNITCIVINSDITENVKGDGEIITLKFKVKEDAAAGEYEIKLGKNTMFSNSSEEIITPKVSMAKITVK